MRWLPCRDGSRARRGRGSVDGVRGSASTALTTELSILGKPRYIVFMFRQLIPAHMRSPWRLLLGLLCVGLVMFSGTLSVTHAHPQGPAFHADCGLCTTAHSVVQVTAQPVQVPVARVFTKIEVFLPAPRSRVLSRFALFTRPPPADANLS